MKVLVASQNKIKAAAVHEAFARLLNEVADVHLAKGDIKSGVSDQPMSLTETATGALNRLENIVSTPGYDYYVAIEGGVYSVDTPAGEKWYESACAAVVHEHSKPELAYGPAYPVPESFIAHLKAGKDLNEAMSVETGIQEAGKGAGFNGWLTDNRIDRQKASADAVLLALYGLRQEEKS